MRRRNREEKKRTQQEQVERMRRKQVEHEIWRRRRLRWKPILITIPVVLLIGGALLYRTYYR